MNSPPPRRDLAAWCKELAHHQMPVFARTARSVVSRATDSESSAAELAKQILQDASMTARLLRMANSSYFNPSGGKINTVSRAIIVLGFDVVRDICLSIALIDSFVNATDREAVTREMARAFHAAVQAKSLAELSKQKDPEEIFIATLLYRLGKLAFWCCAGRVDPAVTERLQVALRGNQAKVDEIERDLLGFGIGELTALLNKEWRLSNLLGQALDPSQTASARSQTVGLGHEIAAALEHGRDSEAMRQVLRKIGKTLGLRSEDVLERVEVNARMAAETVARLGAPEAAGLIPTRNQESAVAATPSANAPATEPLRELAKSEPASFGGDQQLQLDILRDISLLLTDGKATVNALMEMVLEGIFRGVGTDHAVFALISPDKTQIRAKFTLGSARDRLQSEFAFPLQAGSAHPITRALKTGEAVWVDGPGFESYTASVDVRLKQLCGGACFLMPLAIGATPIGCLYADRAASARPLTAEAFDQFKLFGQQARMGLAFLKAR